MGAAAAAAADRVLALTSAVRTAIDRAPAGDDEVGELGRRLIEESERAGLVHLARSARGLCDLAAASADAIALRRAVGLVEQVLDGCRVEADASTLERLSGATSGREIGLDGEEDWEPQVDWSPTDRVAAPAASPPRQPTAPAGEPTLVAAFAVEALEALDQCEDRVLRHELSPQVGALAHICAELQTIVDAGAALEIDFGADDEPDPEVDVDTVLDAIDTLRERIETAWAEADAGPVDATSPLPLDELFLRLRRVARDVARRQGGMLVLDAHGGDAAITVGLAGRIFDPLAQMIADAAERVGPGGCDTLHIRAERDTRSLSLTIEPDGDAADLEESEALHWIDARRPATESEVDRLRYRPGAVNVVQVMIA